MQYRAIFQRNGETIRTNWRVNTEAAQLALGKRPEVGAFHPLGQVAGDVFEHGICTAAPRNGGLVSIESRGDW